MNARDTKRILRETALISALLELETELDGYHLVVRIFGNTFTKKHRHIQFIIRDATNVNIKNYGIYHGGKSLKTIKNTLAMHLRTINEDAPWLFKIGGFNRYMKKLNFLMNNESES